MIKWLSLLAPKKAKAVLSFAFLGPVACLIYFHILDDRQDAIIKDVRVKGDGHQIAIDFPVDEAFKAKYGKYRRMADGKGKVTYGFNDFTVLTSGKKRIVSYTLLETGYPINGNIDVGSSFSDVKRVYGEPDAAENMWDEKAFLYYNKKEKRYLRFFVKKQVVQKIEYGKMVPLPSHQELLDG